MRRLFEDELNELHVRFSEMGMMVNEAIYKSVKAFINHDKQLAREVIADDHKINERETDLERKSFELIALQQPVSTDLRIIVTIMKASSDLERMGDHAVSIAKSTIRVKGNTRVPDIEKDIADMADKVKQMVEEVLDAYVKEDGAEQLPLLKKIQQLTLIRKTFTMTVLKKCNVIQKQLLAAWITCLLPVTWNELVITSQTSVNGLLLKNR